MEDKDVKKRLKKVPDKDEHGEPIWKIEEDAARSEMKKRSKVPLFLKDSKSAPQGNPQDQKDETAE